MAGTMRAFVITGPGAAEVRDLPRPEPGAGEVVVDVERAGVCGTDVEFYTGEMAYLDRVAFPVAFQGRGLGRAMYAEVERLAAERQPNATDFTLEVNLRAVVTGTRLVAPEGVRLEEIGHLSVLTASFTANTDSE